MKTLLRIDASPRVAESHSRRFADTLMEHLLASKSGWRTVRRDLSDGPPSAIDEPYVRAMLTHFTREESATAPELTHSERLVGELDDADAVVIASPVHNYTVPASLKAWIDQVVRVGRTFKSTPQGKLGSLKDRPTFVVASSGGYFSGSAAAQPDFFVPYLNAVLATIGIQDVRYIRLEGLSRGAEAVETAYRKAHAALAATTLP
jgi:FMN-dependent NADH-azoreductase